MRRAYWLVFLLLSGCAVDDLIEQSTNNFDFKQQKWIPVDVGVSDNLNAIQMVDANTGYIVGDGGIVLKTQDAGASWQPGYPAVMTGQKLISVSFVSPAQGFVASDSLLFATQDAGHTWGVQARFKDDTHDTIRRARFVTAGAGYVAGEKKAFQSLDGGKTWQALQLVHVQDFETTGAEVFAGGGNIYRGKVGAGWTGVLSADHACDGCSSWLNFTSPTHGWAIITGVKSFGSGDTLVMLRTTDGGATWTNLPTQDYQGKPLNKYLFGSSYDAVRALHFTDNQRGWMLYGGGMLSTYDGGQTWVAQHQAFMDRIGQTFSTYQMEAFIAGWGMNGLDAVDGNHGWVVGNKGLLYRYGGQDYPAFHQK